jgi:hypothetical protein
LERRRLLKLTSFEDPVRGTLAVSLKEKETKQDQKEYFGNANSKSM